MIDDSSIKDPNHPGLISKNENSNNQDNISSISFEEEKTNDVKFEEDIELDDEYETSSPIEKVVSIGTALSFINSFVSTKFEEINKSEAVIKLKQKAAPIFQNAKDASIPVWEAVTDFTAKNTTVLRPVLEQASIKTAETLSYSWELAKEASSIAVENMKPTIDLVSTQTASSLSAISDALETAAVATAEGVQGLTSSLSDNPVPNAQKTTSNSITI